MKLNLLLASTALLVTNTSTAFINGLFSTGVDSNGDVLASGDEDPNWTITASPSGSGFTDGDPAIVLEDNPAWVPGDSSSDGTEGARWIGITGSGDNDDNFEAFGEYTAELTFDLTGFDPATAEISLTTAADNELLDISLNGTPVSDNGGGLSNTTVQPTISSGFLPESNTIAITWNNITGTVEPPDSPTGLLVLISGDADAIPEPSASVGWLFGLSSVLLAFRKREQTRRPSDPDNS